MKPKFFKTSSELRQWLEKNHEKKSELWIGFYKKRAPKTSITPQEALDEALCFGWIDGVRHSVDEISYMNRYTPRTPKSKWSKINVDKVKVLMESGLITPAGLKVIDEAKADGRWERAYDSPSKAQVPDEFLKAIKKNKKAFANFKNLNKQKIYSIVYRLQNSKKVETKERWIEKFIDLLEKDKF